MSLTFPGSMFGSMHTKLSFTKSTRHLNERRESKQALDGNKRKG